MRILPFVLALAVVLGGCSRAPSETASGRHPWTVAHTLRVVDLADPDTLNPYLSEMDVNYAIASLVYSYLIVADDKGRLIGDLATAVPTVSNGGISADGLTYTYHLRSNVRWQDGVPFTSADVVASWKAVIDPAHQTLFRNGYDRVASITTPNRLTVVVHLRERYPPFVTQFFAPLQEGGKPVLAAHVLRGLKDFNRGALARTAIGTGPFRFVSWKRGERISLVRNDDYFRGKPALERIEYHFVPDAQTILTEFATHQVDLMVTPPSGLYPAFVKLPDTSVSLAPWNAQALLIMNGRVPGLNDPRVRRAISQAIDREQLVTTVSHGTATIARDVIAPTSLGYVERAPIPHRYHPIEPKRGYTLAILAGSPTFAAIAVELQSSLREIGITLTIKPYAYGQLFAQSGPLFTGKYDLAVYGSVLSWDPDSHVYFGCDEQYPKGQNIYGYCNRRYDALEAAALRSDDPSVRGPLYAKADGVLWDDAAYIPLYQLQRIVLHNPDLKNYRPNMTSVPFWNAWQWDI